MEPLQSLPPADKNTRAPQKKTKWFDDFRQLAVLVALLFGFKFFVADIFVIPSGSMEPTLHGRENSGDRIFCTKFDFRFRHPKRWEVFVFKFPYDEGTRLRRERGFSTAGMEVYKGENFIKRCVGLPEEELAIVNGDIFTRKRPGETAMRQVKPDAVQRKLWLPVYHEKLTALRKLDDFAESWDIPAGAGVRFSAGILSFDTVVATSLRFCPRDRYGKKRSIRDRYVRKQTVTYLCPQCHTPKRQTVTTPRFGAYCGKCGTFLQEHHVSFYDFRAGYPVPEDPPASICGDPSPRASGWHVVPDLRWRGKARFQGKGAVTAELRNDNLVAVAEWQVDAAGRGNTVLRLDGKEFPGSRAQFTLTAGGWSELEFYFCDGEYRAFVNGKPLFCVAPAGHAAPADLSRSCSSSGAAFGALGKVDFSEITLDRDIYYFRRAENYPYFRLDKGEYLALGDNCPASNDSRDWGPVPEKNLIGPAWFVWWPLDSARIIH